MAKDNHLAFLAGAGVTAAGDDSTLELAHVEVAKNTTVGVGGGLALGFGANPARAVEQHRAAERPEDARPTPPPARVLLAPPRVAAGLAGLGRALPPESVVGCALRGRLPSMVEAGSSGLATVTVVNRSGRPLASVPPRVVKVAARWAPVAEPEPGPTPGDEPVEDAEPVVNPPVALPRLLLPGERAELDVPLEAPDVPGRYELREVVNAIFYQNRTGCQWAYLPHDLPPKSATYYYFARWRDDGTDQVIHDPLHIGPLHQLRHLLFLVLHLHPQTAAEPLLQAQDHRELLLGQHADLQVEVRAAVGLVRTHRGTIRFDGADITALRPSARVVWRRDRANVMGSVPVESPATGRNRRSGSFGGMPTGWGSGLVALGPDHDHAAQRLHTAATELHRHLAGTPVDLDSRNDRRMRQPVV